MSDEIWMRRCFDLARRGAGQVSPNPMVGAVLVTGGRLIGEGWHKALGRAHAEVEAFESVSAADRHLIRGATMFVSLEPCHHHGRTPPCTERIVAEGVRAVCVAAQDSDPRVAGSGLAFLREKGVSVRDGLLAEEARLLNRAFFTFHEKKRPHVILKWAQSSDDFMGRAGESTAISGELARLVNHRWRREADAILVGAGTALVDDPGLTDRHHGGPQPVRLVIDPEGQVHEGLQLMRDSGESWVFSRRGKATPPGSLKRHYVVPEGTAMIPYVLDVLFAEKKASLIVEGGRETLRQWLAEGPWDEARVITNSRVLGEGMRAPGVSGVLWEKYKVEEDVIAVIGRDG